jgi:hypothetical protein
LASVGLTEAAVPRDDSGQEIGAALAEAQLLVGVGANLRTDDAQPFSERTGVISF